MAKHIEVAQSPSTWVVRAGGAVIAESGQALELKEGDLPTVIYFPREDVGDAFLERSETRTHCPYKGDATYYTLVTKSGAIPDAAWSYEAPKDERADIAGFVAFHDDKVTVEQL